MNPIRNWFERKFYGGHQMPSEVNRVGPSGARIIHVGQHRVEYIDMIGQEQFIDLEECAHNWTHWYEDHKDEFIAVPGASEADIAAENARCVGLRGGTYRVWWAEFMNDKKTRFEFGSFEAL